MDLIRFVCKKKAGHYAILCLVVERLKSNSLKATVRTIVVLCATYCVLSVVICNTLITLKPKKFDQREAMFQLQQQLPQDVSLQDVTFPSEIKDASLTGWWIKQPSKHKVAILVHGHNDSKADTRVVAASRLFVKLGFSVLLFDLHNHGNSTVMNNQTSLGSLEYKDVLGAKIFVENQGFNSENIVYWGLSLGGAVCAIAAQHDPGITKLIMDSSFADVDVIIKEEFLRKKVPTIFYPGAMLVARLWYQNPIGRYNPFDLDHTHVSKLGLVHSSFDKRVGVHHSRGLYNLAQTLKIACKYVEVDDSKHGQIVFDYPERYEQLVEFFK